MIEAFLALSVHFLEGDWNEMHPGLRYRHDEWVVGAYYNSESSVSVFGAYDFGNIEIGLVTGYEGADIAPFIRATYDTDIGTLFAAPAMTADGDFGLVVGVEFFFRMAGRSDG